MMKLKLTALLLMIFLWSPLLAQTSKRRSAVRKPVVTTPQTQPVTQPPATTQPARPPAAPTSLVTVSGQTFTTADLQPELRQEVEGLDDKIAEARAAVLDLQINTLL